MLSINTNLSSMIVQSSLKQSTNSLDTAIERMTTGAKINHAKDNAANYSIATSLSSKISSLQVAEDNVSQGLNMVNTALESLSTMSSYTNRLRSLAMQAQNGTYGDKSIDAINSEAISLINELYRTKNTAEYNGISLFGGLEQPTDITFPDGTTEKKYEFINKVTRRDTSTMTSIAELDETATFDGGTYSVSTAEELEKLALMTKNGNFSKKPDIVLANDIDMKDWCEAHKDEGGWMGMSGISKFDGNGYAIKNLESTKACFLTTTSGTIENLAIENVNINFGGTDKAGVFFVYAGTIQNCYVTGTVQGKNQVGGLVGTLKNGTVKNCFTDVNVCTTNGDHSLGGLIGYVDGNERFTIENCYSMGTVNSSDRVGGLIGDVYLRGVVTGSIINCCSTVSVNGNSKVGGLIGNCSQSGKLTIKNCYAVGSVNGSTNTGGLIGDLTVNDSDKLTFSNCYYNAESSGQSDTGKGIGLTSSQLNQMVAQGQLPDYGLDLPVTGINDSSSNRLYAPAFVTFQVGISAEDSAGIYIDLTFAIDGLKDLCYWGLSSTNSLDAIDRMVKSISDKETELGALQNRFESALEQINVSYDNLVSSLSTIQDADIGEVSSEYIRQQILQQASATLMATANQSPSIALQLL